MCAFMELPSASSLIGHIMYAARGVLVVILVTIVVLQAESGAPPQPPPPPQTPASGMTSSDSISAPTEVILATVQVTRSSSQQPDALSKLRRDIASAVHLDVFDVTMPQFTSQGGAQPAPCFCWRQVALS